MQSEEGGDWDGNVPANHRTTDVPPRALGRWINRQRSAYGKDKLKKDYIEKLNQIGLKWSVHERRPGSYPDTPNSAVISAPSSGNDSDPTPNDVSSSAAAPATHGSTPAPTGAAIKSEPMDEEKKAAIATRSCNSSCSSRSSNSSHSSDETSNAAPNGEAAPATCGAAGSNPAPSKSQPEKDDETKSPAAGTGESETGEEAPKDHDVVSPQGTMLPVTCSSDSNIP